MTLSTTMLHETQRELLTAAVDGELSARQELALARLLESSAEARALLRELRAVSQRLHRLPRHTAPPDLAAGIMDRIHPATPANPVRTRRLPRWEHSLPYALAASVLLLAGLGSFWLTFTSQKPRPTPHPHDFTQQKRPAHPPVEILPNRDVAATVAHSPEVLPLPRVATSPDRRMAQLPPESALGSAGHRPAEVAPPPRPMPDWIGAAFTTRPAPLDRVEVRLPLFTAVAEFDRPDVLARMTDELSRESAFRLDLFSTDSAEAVQLLLAVGKEIGLTIRMEPMAHDRLKKKLPANWLLYTEALTGEDCVALAARLAVQARAQAGGVDRLLDGHFYPVRALEQKNLRDLFGVDLSLGKRPPAAKPEPVRSVTASTLSQIEKSLRGASRPGRLAICVLDQPAYLRANPASSREIRQFLDDRGERKPGTIPLIIVIRPSAR